ncbi:MAG TPA: NUDIX hydrolase [Bacteroidota bacterium]
MLRRWKTISSTIVSINPWWTYKRDTFQIPGGFTGEYHYVHTEGSSLVVPVRDDGKLVMVNQYRYLCERESLEFPCGGVKVGKSYDEMARLELEEETGYTADEMKRVGEFNPYNGVTNEICAVYLARQLQVSTAKPDATEEFEILAISPSDLDVMIKRRKVWDGMTLAAWALVKPDIMPK